MSTSDKYAVALMFIGAALSYLLGGPFWGIVLLWIGVGIFVYAHLSGHFDAVGDSAQRTRAADSYLVLQIG